MGTQAVEDSSRGPRGSGEDLYVAVRNGDGRYSIWSAGRPLPPGWAQVGEPGSREDRLGFIESVWEDPILGARPAAGR